MNRVLLALIIIATVPLFAFALKNIGLQLAGSGDTVPTDMAVRNEAVHDQKHIALGHYRNIAVTSFIIILVGVLASFRPKGWRLAAIAWGVAFVAAAELISPK